MVTGETISPREAATRYGIAYWTCLNLLHAGKFGPRGKGWRIVNPDAKRPQYRITPAGLAHYERITG
ncbi:MULTISPECIES: hypothetical protein [unclassified Luteococcus]|uniref:hypothetical protein n=1 Tax=unclassified Luteococcus TaxID=2639923 RepID=UPI00313D70E2